MSFTARPFLLTAGLAVLTGAVLLGSGASAQGPATRTLTFRELDKGAHFTHVRNTRSKSPRANAQGDLIVFTNPLADASGAVVGKLSAGCTTTTGARNFLKSVLTCTGAVALRDGTRTLQVTVSPGVRTSTGAVTGGTGAYANARGVLVSRDTRTGAEDTVTLVG